MTELETILKPALKDYSLTTIARMAGMAPSYLVDIRNGRFQARPATLARLALAIIRLKAKQTDGPAMTHALYRLALVLCSQALGLNAAVVQNSDPAAKQVANKPWRDASFARWLAQYLLNTTLGLKQVDVAKASGVTKQAVSLAMREIELKRDEPEFDDLVAALELQVIGVSDAQ